MPPLSCGVALCCASDLGPGALREGVALAGQFLVDALVVALEVPNLFARQRGATTLKRRPRLVGRDLQRYPFRPHLTAAPGRRLQVGERLRKARVAPRRLTVTGGALSAHPRSIAGASRSRRNAQPRGGQSTSPRVDRTTQGSSGRHPRNRLATSGARPHAANATALGGAPPTSQACHGRDRNTRRSAGITSTTPCGITRTSGVTFAGSGSGLAFFVR
jgi:hypothetical protein